MLIKFLQVAYIYMPLEFLPFLLKTCWQNGKHVPDHSDLDLHCWHSKHPSPHSFSDEGGGGAGGGRGGGGVIIVN